MELVHWRPFGGELSSFRREMDKFWNSLFGGAPSSGTLTEEWVPSVDISETKDNFVIRAELPGLEASDVNVAVSEDLLTIKGEKKKEEEEKDEHHYCAERYYGAFQRVFQLPASIKADKVDATFKKGVLKVTLPKAEEAKRKAICHDTIIEQSWCLI